MYCVRQAAALWRIAPSVFEGITRPFISSFVDFNANPRIQPSLVTIEGPEMVEDCLWMIRSAVEYRLGLEDEWQEADRFYDNEQYCWGKSYRYTS